MTTDHTLDQDRADRERSQSLSQKRDHPPTSVPGYEPERFLGAGAYGEVWTAVNRNTGRRVAIKFYAHRGGLDWSLLSREVEKLRFLFADRHAVQLLDVGWDADPPYYVMEYMAQGALEDRLRNGPLPAEEALRLFREVATGLQHAHGKGVLHCDLKPANVLLDQDGNPRLADFGQSRLSHEQTPSLGTLYYMAPEQADLKAVPHARWDVYALGALLYTMLVGHAPYRNQANESELATAVDLEDRLARYRRMLQHAPPPREHRKVPGVDRHLAEITERCLAIDQHKRFSNVQSVLDALNLRRVRRAQRPLLILGAGAPVLLLAVMSIFSLNAFSTAIEQSQKAVTDRALESNRFAAQFVAETVARQIDRRWQILEQEAARQDFRDALAEAQDQPRDGPERRQLQAMITRLALAHPEMNAASWFVTNREGKQIARYPMDEKTIDQNFAHRDYFHGQGRDLPEGTGGLVPLERPHRSNVFTSQATNHRMVAFSVCVWNHDERDSERTTLGVIAMTVELGQFAELRPEDIATEGQVAVLVDSRPDAQGLAGAVLEHPYLAAHLRGNFGPLPDVYLPEKEIQRLNQLRPLKLKSLEAHAPAEEPAAPRGFAPGDKPAGEGTLTASLGKKGEGETEQEASAPVNPIRAPEVEAAKPAAIDPALARQLRDLAVRPEYVDPVGATERGSSYRGPWLAAVEPVFVAERPADIRDTGWAVIVQERFAEATRPIDALGPRLQRMGLIALGVVGALLTLLWGFVILVLDDAPQSALLVNLRRGFGLGSMRPGSGASLKTNAPTPHPKTTVDYRGKS